MADLSDNQFMLLKVALSDQELADRLRDLLNAESTAFPASVSFTIGTEGTDAINVAMQFKDSRGADMAVPCQALLYVTSDSAGQALQNPPVATPAVGTDGTLLATLGTRNVQLFVSEADGDLDVTYTDASGAITYYLNVVIGGKVFTSSAIIFAA